MNELQLLDFVFGIKGHTSSKINLFNIFATRTNLNKRTKDSNSACILVSLTFLQLIHRQRIHTYQVLNLYIFLFCKYFVDYGAEEEDIVL